MTVSRWLIFNPFLSHFQVPPSGRMLPRCRSSSVPSWQSHWPACWPCSRDRVCISRFVTEAAPQKMPFRSDRRWLSVVSARSARIKSSSPFSTSLCSLQSSPAPPRPLCHTGFKVQLIVCSLRFPIYSPTSEGCGEGPVVNNCLFSAAFCCCDRCFL